MKPRFVQGGFHDAIANSRARFEALMRCLVSAVCFESDMGVSKNWGSLSEGLYNKGRGILGSIVGGPVFRTSHIPASLLRSSGAQERHSLQPRSSLGVVL